MIVMHSSSDLGECAGCAKWGPHFQFTHFNWAHVFGLRTFNNLLVGSLLFMRDEQMKVDMLKQDL